MLCPIAQLVTQVNDHYDWSPDYNIVMMTLS